MNIQELLHSFPCTCGHEHRCDIQHVEIGRGAVSALTALCRDAKTVLVISDENTFAAAGAQTMAALAGKEILSVTYRGDTLLVPNEEAVAAMEPHLGRAEAIVAIGAGVMQDLGKYGASMAKIPCHVVATAPSMDGYASTGAAMIMGGMKVTYPGHVPSVILADTEILKDAPMEMIQAGYGDIVGKFSALNDWKLSHIVLGESFCQENYDLIEQMLKKTLSLADGLVNRDEESVRVLMEALVIVGIAMAFVGSSRPASGSEHHLSHYFEIVGIVRNEDYFCHGIDVAYSTVVTAALRDEILSKPWPDSQFRLPREEYEAEVVRIYGPVAEGCIALQDKVGLYNKDMLSIYKAKEAEIRAVLSEVPKASEIEAMLNAVGMDMSQFYKLYSKEKIADAILYAKELKDRYTVLWLYYDLFGKQ